MAENEQTPEAQDGDSLFSKLSQVKPASGVKDDDGDNPLDDDGGGSISRRMKLSPKMSDTQVVDKRLFPILIEGEQYNYLNNLMVARVFPETLNPLRNILIKDLLQEHPNMSFAEAVAHVEVALTVAIDGEGRMDIIHLFSKMEDKEDDKEKSKLI